LMSNHYHLLLETPQANLTAGMGWFQNAYTRRINTRHRLWGHLFGGRYKAIGKLGVRVHFLSIFDSIQGK
jgi:putative transposase